MGCEPIDGDVFVVPLRFDGSSVSVSGVDEGSVGPDGSEYGLVDGCG